jgi:hypothetical protein
VTLINGGELTPAKPLKHLVLLRESLGRAP